jgi:outer membrane protein OmpA-like peptidoglycan-associated protein
MTRLALLFARGLGIALFLSGVSQAFACNNKVTTISSETPIQVQAQPPAPPLPELPAVPQPPPPPRVILEGDRLVLDEALTFGADEQLSSEHADIIAELAKWLAQHEDVLELTVEVHSIGEGSRRVQQKRSKALAMQIVDALVREGIASERLVAGSVGASPDGQQHVALRVSKRAEATEMTIVPE